MKKARAIILTIIGVNAVFFGISIAVYQMLLYLDLNRFVFVAAIILTVGATFGISRLRGVFADHYGIASLKFFLCAYVSSAAASALFFLIAVCVARFNAEYGFVFGIIWMLVSGAAVVLGAAMLAISAKLRAKRNIGS